MKINKVTITGADDSVDHNDLVALQLKYPFVEWGILFSEKRAGKDRYPTMSWIQRLSVDLKLSAHLCGGYSRSIFEDGDVSFLHNLHSSFKRVQINYNFGYNQNWSFRKMLAYASTYSIRQIVLQYNKSNNNSIYHLIDEECNGSLPDNINLLYDSSGGRGNAFVALQPPFKGIYTGYSGGISPLNIKEVCSVIYNSYDFAVDEEVWIDMESGVRTDNKFDLSKVEYVLEMASLFINNKIQTNGNKEFS